MLSLVGCADGASDGPEPPVNQSVIPAEHTKTTRSALSEGCSVGEDLWFNLGGFGWTDMRPFRMAWGPSCHAEAAEWCTSWAASYGFSGRVGTLWDDSPDELVCATW